MTALADAVTRLPKGAALVVPPDPSWPPAQPALAAQVLDLVNAHRATLGLTQLGTVATLTAAAEWKSRHEAFYGYPLNHDDPAPPIARTWYQRLLDNGYPGGLCGENIAGNYLTAQDVVNGWLASDGHRQNIENPTYNITGIGTAVSSTFGRYWTQSFGLGTPDGPPSPVGPSNRELADTVLAQLKLTTIGYAKWSSKVYKPASARAGTAWQKALDALAKIS